MDKIKLEYNLRLNGSNNFTITGNNFIRGNSLDNQTGVDVQFIGTDLRLPTED